MPEFSRDVTDILSATDPDVERVRARPDDFHYTEARHRLDEARESLEQVLCVVLRHKPDSLTARQAKFLLDSLKWLDAGCGAVPP
jgi:hypothetical protein